MQLGCDDVAHYISNQADRCKTTNFPGILSSDMDANGTSVFRLGDAAIKNPSVRLKELREKKRRLRQQERSTGYSNNTNGRLAGAKSAIHSAVTRNALPTAASLTKKT